MPRAPTGPGVTQVRRRAEAAGWIVAMAAGLVLDVAAFGPARLTAWLPDVLVGWTFLGCALLIRWRAPDDRVGLLLGLVGFTWFLGGLDPSLSFLHRGPLVHLAFGYPGGRVHGVGRVVVPAAYLVAMVPGAWGSELASIGLAVALLIAVSLHRNHARGPLRRARHQAAVGAGAVALILIGSAVARLALAEGDADQPTLLLYEISLVVAALATARGVLAASWLDAPVTDLVVQLSNVRSNAVRDALARELGDPSLQVGYRDGAGFVDASGRPLALPTGETMASTTTVEHLGRPVAVLVHDPAVRADPALLHAVAAAARLAEQNSRLQQDVDARVRELEASRRRLIVAADAERGRLVQRLADGAERRLDDVAVSLQHATTSATGRTATQVLSAQREVDRLRSDLRELAAGLLPRELQQGDLQAALEDLAARSPIPVQLTSSLPTLPSEIAAATWFVCAEAVANAVKHAAASHIRVDAGLAGEVLQLSVVDDGRGGADPASGSGLAGLRDRVEALGGQLRLQSQPGSGTALAASIPLVVS